MCGIVGAFSALGLSQYRAELVRSIDVVAYRGPDGEGALIGTVNSGISVRRLERARALLEDSAAGTMDVFLGHRRLSIIDLSAAGAQPMVSADQSAWIVYNGEIYNYIELRDELRGLGYSFRSDTDTEVILAAYDRWGVRCVDRFAGMWAFCILDSPNQRLFLSRDRFGIKPLHYCWDGRHFAFASEIKQLLCFSFLSPRLNRQAAYEYLHFGSFDHSGSTFFTHVERLPPGHNLLFDLRTNALHIDRYYQPAMAIRDAESMSGAAEQFRQLFMCSVKQHLRSDVEVGSCLSGGLDSSSIVCAVANALHDAGASGRQRTFSSHFEEKEANERSFMDAVVRATGVKAHFVYPTPERLLEALDRLIWHQEEPFGSTSLFAQWSVFETVGRQGLKVMLDGQGADEQLAGYVGFLPTYLQELSVKQRRLLRAYEWTQCTRRHSVHIPRASWKRLLSRPVSDHQTAVSPCIRPDFQAAHHDASDWLKFQREEPFGPKELLNNLLYQMTFHHNLPALLRYEDRSSMAFSVEARVPFLDHRLVEFVLCLPSSYKIRHGMTKYVMRQAMRGVLPEKIRKRIMKLGFATPENKWQVHNLKGMIMQAIGSSELEEFLNPAAARRNFKMIEELQITDFAPWRWLNLYLWMRRFRVA